MGGQGSGYYLRCSSKRTTGGQDHIDIRWLKQRGLLRPGTAGTLSWSSRGERTGSIGYRMYADHMVLDYRSRSLGDNFEDVEQIIHFDRTRCHYGGNRAWFLCPQCCKRVAIIYGAGKYFLCRRCNGLTYASQQENKMFRLMTKSQMIRKRLGGSGNLSDCFPCKPKNMHWQTYRRLRFESERADALSSEMVHQRFGANDLWG